jgi:hypothetical protein
MKNFMLSLAHAFIIRPVVPFVGCHYIEPKMCSPLGYRILVFIVPFIVEDTVVTEDQPWAKPKAHRR